MILCSMPECQTTAGCKCGERFRLYDAALSRLADYADEIIRKLTKENERMRTGLEGIVEYGSYEAARKARAALGKDTPK